MHAAVRRRQRSIARTPTPRANPLYLRSDIARFLEDHAETEGDMAIVMRASDQLPVSAAARSHPRLHSTRQTNQRR
jgi:hypothetical protein